MVNFGSAMALLLVTAFFDSFTSDAYNFGTILVVVWISVCLFAVIWAIRYRAGKASYLLLPVLNDKGSRLRTGIMACIVLSSSILFTRYYPFNHHTTMGFILSFLLFLFTWIQNPSGVVFVRRGGIALFGLEGKIPLDKIERISIHQNTISLISPDNYVWYGSGYDISVENAGLLYRYLAEKTKGSGICIEDHVSPKEKLSTAANYTGIPEI